MDDSCDSATHCIALVNGETLVEGFVGREDLSSLLGNAGGLVSDVNGPVHFPVEQVDASFSWAVCEGHIVEHDAVMLACELAKVIHVGDNEGIVEAMGGPLGFPCVSGAPHKEHSEVFLQRQTPMGGRVSVLEVLLAFDVISDSPDISDCPDVHSGDLARFPEGSSVANSLNNLLVSCGSIGRLFK